jgi:hypothetical protein
MINPWYPLPADYGDLTADGQRQARLFTLTSQGTPKEFVTAWDLFRRLYLQNTEPGFFYDDLVESPSFHYEMIEDVGRYIFNVFGAPRGFAKSTIIAIELVLFLLITRPYFKVGLCVSTDRILERQFDKLMVQLGRNPNVIQDFGVLQPKKGEGIWNHHTLTLTNGSVAEGFSVTGRKRGARPNLFVLDDPEYDPETNSESARQLIAENFEVLLFRQIMPMLERHCGLAWIGTIIGVRNYLYYACYTEDDPRFNSWNRKVYSAVDSSGISLWTQKWDEKFLEHKKMSMGSAAFDAEYQGKPSSDQDRLLTVDSTKNEYFIDPETVTNQDSPLTDADALLSYHIRTPDGRWDIVKTSPAELFKTLYKFVTFDYAEGLSPHHDYSCVAALGFDKYRCLWVLDMWMGRAQRPVLLSQIYKMGMKWNARTLGIECVGLQGELVEAMAEYVDEFSENSPLHYRPHVVPVKYPSGASKAFRIQGLQWRYEAGKIKYPRHLKHKWPINQLYTQTSDFTVDLALLPHDDAIDTVAMSQYMLKSRGIKPMENDGQVETLTQRLQENRLHIAGVPILSGLNASELSAAEMQAVLDIRHKDVIKQMKKRERDKRPRIQRRTKIATRPLVRTNDDGTYNNEQLSDIDTQHSTSIRIYR